MIICCGDALIDMLPERTAEGDYAFLPKSGGAIFNTCLGLGRLGSESGLLAGISTDLLGNKLIEDLNASGVSTRYCVRSGLPTTLALVAVNEGQASYTFYDENSAGQNLMKKMLPELPANLSALHFGGISLISDPSGATFEHLMTQYHTQILISLDPNIRPDFISNPQQHRARIMRLIKMSDVVKLSDEDMDWLFPDIDHIQTITELIEGSAKVILLTRGRDGVSACGHWGITHYSAIETKIVDSIGAGDAFNAGFLHRLSQQGNLSKVAMKQLSMPNLEDAVKFAIRTATLTLTRAGAEPPWLSELPDA